MQQKMNKKLNIIPLMHGTGGALSFWLSWQWNWKQENTVFRNTSAFKKNTTCMLLLLTV